jgi:hypothetical protein
MVETPHTKSEEFKMPFGKYEGVGISAIPANYLAWLVGTPAPTAIKRIARDEIDRRANKIRDEYKSRQNRR